MLDLLQHLIVLENECPARSIRFGQQETIINRMYQNTVTVTCERSPRLIMAVNIGGPTMVFQDVIYQEDWLGPIDNPGDWIGDSYRLYTRDDNLFFPWPNGNYRFDLYTLPQDCTESWSFTISDQVIVQSDNERNAVEFEVTTGRIDINYEYNDCAMMPYGFAFWEL